MSLERWEMELNHATGRYEIGTPDAVPYCQFAEVNGEERARLASTAPALLAGLRGAYNDVILASRILAAQGNERSAEELSDHANIYLDIIMRATGEKK
jgi:hypothetical protein